jgi:hypothetical protein
MPISEVIVLDMVKVKIQGMDSLNHLQHSSFSLFSSPIVTMFVTQKKKKKS